MKKLHKWTKVTFFKSICDKCGCEKEKTAVRFPCETNYTYDGKVSDHAPECTERFVPKPVPIQKELFHVNDTIF